MTAVDLFKKQVVELAVQMQHQKINLYQFLIELGDLGEEAKEMEKQQKIDFANKYADSDCIYCSGEFDIEKRADEFYEETFKKD